MAKNPARYTVMFGLEGCYMPDSTFGTFELHTRRDFAAMIRDAIEFYELPKSSFGAVNVRRVWGFISRNGSSSAHFTIRHGANALQFSGLTEAEYQDATREDC